MFLQACQDCAEYDFAAELATRSRAATKLPAKPLAPMFLAGKDRRTERVRKLARLRLNQIYKKDSTGLGYPH